MSSSTKRRGGFTLTEVMVVVTVLLLLAALLFPVFSRARDRSREEVCASNLRQLGVALAAYEMDFDGSGQYGDYASMGLPPNALILRNYEHLPKALLTCAGHRVGLKHSLYCYHPFSIGDETRKEWANYARNAQGDAVVFADFNHRNGEKSWDSPFVSQFALGLHLDGHVTRKVGFGMMCTLGFWIH